MKTLCPHSFLTTRMLYQHLLGRRICCHFRQLSFSLVPALSLCLSFSYQPSGSLLWLSQELTQMFTDFRICMRNLTSAEYYSDSRFNDLFFFIQLVSIEVYISMAPSLFLSLSSCVCVCVMVSICLCLFLSLFLSPVPHNLFFISSMFHTSHWTN